MHEAKLLYYSFPDFFVPFVSFVVHLNYSG